jgi:excisionase family DNA binding protein
MRRVYGILVRMSENGDTATVPEAAKLLDLHPESVRRLIRSGHLYAERSTSGKRSAFAIDRAQLERFAEQRAAGRRIDRAGVVASYDPREFADEVERKHGKPVADELRARMARLDALDQLITTIDSTGLDSEFEQLDHEQHIEQRAQELAAQVRKRERIRNRALELLDEDADR